MNKNLIIKLISSKSYDDRIMGFSFMAKNYDVPKFLRDNFRSDNFHYYKAGDRIGFTRETTYYELQALVFRVSPDYCIYSDGYWLFLEITNPEYINGTKNTTFHEL